MSATTRVIARVLLVLGFLAASVGYSSWTAARTIFDPSATRGATQALLSTPAVRATLAREIRTALAPAIGAKTGDPKLTAAINAAVKDPKFVGAFEDAIMSLHEGILSGGNGKVTLDTHAVTDAIKQAVARVDPAIAPKVQKLRSVKVPIGSSSLPSIGNVRDKVTLVRNAAIAIAILLVGGALLLAPSRKMFRRAGLRLALLAVPPAVVFGVAPHLLHSAHNSGLEVAAVLLGSYGHRVLFSAGFLAVAGISTWLIALAMPSWASLSAPDDEPTGDRPATKPYVPPISYRTPATESTAAIPEKLYL